MIAVKLNQAGFEYDIHSLVKAFYLESEVKVFVENTENIVSDKDYPELYQERTETDLQTSIRKNDVTCVTKKTKIKHDITKKELRNVIKRQLYLCLLEYTGKKLPWGSLTGIRPVKIAMSLLEEGRKEQDIISYLKDVYFVSEKKAKLAVDIAGREKALLSGFCYEKGYSLYIGIPFCPTTCLYCSFTSYPVGIWRDKVKDYLDTLIREMEETAVIFSGRKLDTVYIGGGTPTTLTAEELAYLLGHTKRIFDFANVKEFTVEAGRADSITKEKLSVLKEYGVTRISVNPQTMNQDTLRLIGRQHTVEQVRDAFRLAREYGFENINMDLILGLPGEKEKEVRYTTQQIEELKPDSLTVHSLAVKRASGLHAWMEENKVSGFYNTSDTMEIAASAAKRMNMKPYYLYRQKNMSGNFENVGYAREGCFGLYNILIMEEVQDIVALGAGSISKRIYPDGKIERCDNVKDVSQYIARIGEMIERKRVLFEKFITVQP